MNKMIKRRFFHIKNYGLTYLKNSLCQKVYKMENLKYIMV